LPPLLSKHSFSSLSPHFFLVFYDLVASTCRFS
jgi:hypothetical protein